MCVNFQPFRKHRQQGTSIVVPVHVLYVQLFMGGLSAQCETVTEYKHKTHQSQKCTDFILSRSVRQLNKYLSIK